MGFRKKREEDEKQESYPSDWEEDEEDYKGDEVGDDDFVDENKFNDESNTI